MNLLKNKTHIEHEFGINLFRYPGNIPFAYIFQLFIVELEIVAYHIKHNREKANTYLFHKFFLSGIPPRTIDMHSYIMQ